MLFLHSLKLKSSINFIPMRLYNGDYAEVRKR